jgi:multiple sugar transport system ATP-binding protein
MNEGRLLQVGDPHEVYARPADVFVARFIGSPSINLLAARLRGDGEGLWVEVPGDGGTEGLRQRVPASAARVMGNGTAPDSLTLGVRPEDLVLQRTEAPGRLPARVDFVQPMGSVSYAILRLPNGADVIRERDHLIAAIGADETIGRGADVWLEPRGERICLFDDATGRAMG